MPLERAWASAPVVGHDRLAGPHRQRHRVGRMAGEQHLAPVALEHEPGLDAPLVPSSTWSITMGRLVWGHVLTSITHD